MAELRRILLATDLSARCDRALERAASLVASYGASITVLHVFEGEYPVPEDYLQAVLPSWQRPPDPVAVAKERIRSGLRAEVADLLAAATVRVEEGEAGPVIERVARELRSDLIITGIARERALSLRPVTLGRTVDRLLRQAPAPLLIVKNRALLPYGHILVATDLSPASVPAIKTALAFFPDRILRLLHAYEAPYAGLVADPATYTADFGSSLQDELRAFIDTLGCTPAERQRIQPLIEPGRAAGLVLSYVRDRQADLVVLGTHGRGALLETLAGSTTKEILGALPCDVLVVRATRED